MTNKQAQSFLTEMFLFTEEQNAAIYHQTEMTPELFDSILDRCVEIGPSATNIFNRVCADFPELADTQVERMINFNACDIK